MGISREFIEFKRPERCPVCGHCGRCKNSTEQPDDLILCFRQSAEQVNGFRRIKTTNECSTYVRIGSPADNGKAPSLRQPRRTDLDALAPKYAAAMSDARLQGIATDLGVSTDSLRAIDIGWDGQTAVIPERDADGKVTALNSRRKDGTKRVGRGEKRGLYIPGGFTDLSDPVLIPEGASDVAACVTMGLTAVGRPSNSGGAKELAKLLGEREVLVLGENDRKPDGSWPGRDGAIKVARQIATTWGRPVKYALPPDGTKDVRAYLLARPDRDPAEVGKELLAYLMANAQVVSPSQNVSHKESPQFEAVVRVMSDVQAKPVEWTWPNRFARGHPHFITALPDMGKSYITLWISAWHSQGRRWPDCEAIAEVGDTIILSGENHPEQVIRPRLDAMGAECRRVRIIDAIRDTRRHQELHPDLTRHLPAIETALRHCENPIQLIIDPINAFLGDNTDSSKDNEVRGILSPLASLAERHRLVVVCVSHLRKDESGPAIYRTVGSIAYVAAARVVWAVGADPADPDRRLMVCAKNNLAPRPLGLAYRFSVVPPGETPALQWERDPVIITAEQLFAPRAGRSKKGECVDWLQLRLANGPVAEKAIEAEAKALGYGRSTLNRAKKALGAKSDKPGFANAWQWSLSQDAQDQAISLNTFEGAPGEHLRENASPTPQIKGAQDDHLRRYSIEATVQLNTFEDEIFSGEEPPTDYLAAARGESA